MSNDTADPLISVLIPAYNRAGTLEQCVRSAAANGYANLQIIISDNGSTDGTADLARRLAADDQRITVIAHPVNRGPLPNWRACLDSADGVLVHWLWSDDWLEPGFYRALVDAMQAQDAQMALCAARIDSYAGAPDDILYRWGDGRLEGRQAAKRFATGGWRLAPASPACALLPTASCRAAFTDAIPLTVGIDCNRRAIGCDSLMLISAAWSSRRVATLDAPLAVFRAHGDSISISCKPWFLSGHYAWARLWLGEKLGLPRSWRWADRLRLWRFRVRHAWNACTGRG